MNAIFEPREALNLEPRIETRRKMELAGPQSIFIMAAKQAEIVERGCAFSAALITAENRQTSTEHQRISFGTRNKQHDEHSNH